ncbi:MAG: hypothetical protein M3O85_02940 [Acidobacteriota bacterium]|nr:hypothetical protein [Acidobacteriota bacterium]
MHKPDSFGRPVDEVLQFELDFLEQGGYGRSVRRPWQPKVMFMDSPTCLNFNDPERPHACSGCVLMDFVPQEHRGERVPCHHIPLTASGDTVTQLFDSTDDAKLQNAVQGWLKGTLKRLRTEEETEAGEAKKWCAET